MIDERPDGLGQFKIGGREDEALHAGARRLCGHGVRQITGGRTGGGIETELLRLGDSHGNNSVLERKCRMVDRVILEVNLFDAPRPRQIIGLHEGGKARIKPGDGIMIDGKKFPVTPHMVRSGRYLLLRHILLDRTVVVRHFERSETKLAYVYGIDSVFPAAFHACQSFHIVLHYLSSSE